MQLPGLLRRRMPRSWRVPRHDRVMARRTESGTAAAGPPPCAPGWPAGHQRPAAGRLAAWTSGCRG